MVARPFLLGLVSVVLAPCIMRRRGFLLAVLLSFAPATLMGQRREPVPLPPAAPISVFPKNRDAAPPETPRPEFEQKRVTGVMQHVAIGALAGGTLGFGAYLVQEDTTLHTDHEMDPLVRFGMVAVGTVAGTLSGVIVHGLRTR